MNWLNPIFTKDLVSIVIPTFNRADLILDTINSAINQDYKNLEIIIVDDGSTDNTEDIIKKIVNNCTSSVRYIKQEKKGGPSARNEGARQSNGEFLQFFDSDDLMHTNYISKRVELLKVDHMIDYCISNCEFVDMVDNETVEPSKYDKYTHTIESLIEQRLPIMTQSLIGRRKFFNDLGPWDEKILRGQDLEYFSRIYFHNFQGLWIPDILCSVRIHNKNLSLSWSPDICKNIIQTYQKIQKNASIYNLSSSKLNQVISNKITSFSIKGLQSGYIKIGWRYFILYWRYLPIKKKILRGGYFVFLNAKNGISLIKKLKFQKLFPKARTKDIIWSDFEYFDETWRTRIELMAKYINSHDSVLDLGCGKMWLLDYLGRDNKYIGVDYKKRDENTLICDFAKNEFPKINADVSFVSGTLEYIPDFENFILQISKASNRCIISYCSTDFFKSISNRKKLGWKNHLSRKELVYYFNQNEFELIEQKLTNENNSILYFIKKK